MTLETGLLDTGVRTQVLPWSTPLTHSCWKVACAETEAAAAKRPRTEVVFIVILDMWFLKEGERECEIE